jgi:hypothetical protein
VKKPVSKFAFRMQPAALRGGLLRHRVGYPPGPGPDRATLSASQTAGAGKEGALVCALQYDDISVVVGCVCVGGGIETSGNKTTKIE